MTAENLVENLQFRPDQDHAAVENTAGMHFRACVYTMKEDDASITKGFEDQSGNPTPEKMNVATGNRIEQTTSTFKGRDGQQYQVWEARGELNDVSVEILGPNGFTKVSNEKQADTALADLKIFQKNIATVKPCDDTGE